jgi:hypothetical protein
MGCVFTYWYYDTSNKIKEADRLCAWRKCAFHLFGKHHEKTPAISLVVDGDLKETGYDDVT